MKKLHLFSIFCFLIFGGNISSVHSQISYVYQLSSSFQSTYPEAPDLIQIPNNDGLTGEFVTREVPESTCGQTGSAEGYFFEDDAGLQFNNPEGFIDQSYSIAFNFQVDEFIYPPAWVRILSFTHVDDVGLYLALTNNPDNGTLEFWPFGYAGEWDFFSPIDFYQMILVRNDAGLIKVYVNGSEFAEYDDSETQAYVPQDPDNFIIWFRDHPSVLADEASPGFVSDIVLANYPWTSDEVSQKWEDFCSDLLTIFNQPPVAICQDVTVDSDENCVATVSASEVDNGSSDPDGDPILFELSPEGPYSLGSTLVTLTVTDDSGEFDQCTATITVVDNTPPVITNISPEMEFVIWPPNHTYETYTLEDFIASIEDNCTGSVPIDDVTIINATSDEPDNSEGEGDGNTIDDIVISGDCKSIQLRKERQGTGNGRVYEIYFEVDDGNGNLGTATCQVQVPSNNNGTAIDDGDSYVITGDCINRSSFVVFTDENIQLTNYPNPFNGNTTITFTLAETDYTTLKVYNTLGKELATLFDGMAESGQQYTLDFSSGNLPDGIYVYHLQSGSKVSVVKKMILNKYCQYSN